MKMVTERSVGSKGDSFRTSFSNYLNTFGTTIVVNSITETMDSMNRVISSSTSSATIPADVQWITKSDLMHLNLGKAQIGDGMLFVKYNVSINLEDEIVYKGITWRIVEQMEGEEVGGEVTYKGYIIRKNA